MRNNNKNERKKFVLALLNNSIYCTAKEIIYACRPISASSIRTALTRYCSQGLLKREREKKNDPYTYQITEKGKKKLEWLMGEDNSIKNQIELLATEPIKRLPKEIEELLLIREKIRALQ